MKYLGLTETKLFHFHRIFNKWGGGGRGGCSREPPKPPLDPPLKTMICLTFPHVHDIITCTGVIVGIAMTSHAHAMHMHVTPNRVNMQAPRDIQS